MKTKKIRLAKETILQLDLTQVSGGAAPKTWSECPTISCQSCVDCSV